MKEVAGMKKRLYFKFVLFPQRNDSLNQKEPVRALMKQPLFISNKFTSIKVSDKKYIY